MCAEVCTPLHDHPAARLPPPPGWAAPHSWHSTRLVDTISRPTLHRQRCWGLCRAGSLSRGTHTAALQEPESCFPLCSLTVHEPTSCGQIFSLLPFLPTPGILCLFNFINLVGDTNLSVFLTCFPSNNKFCHHLKCLLAINLSDFVKYVLCIVSSFPWLARLFPMNL